MEYPPFHARIKHETILNKHMTTPVQIGLQQLPGAPMGIPLGVPTQTFLHRAPQSAQLPPPEVPGEGLKRAINYLADYGGCGYYRCMAPNFLLNLYQKSVIVESTAMILDPKFYQTVQAVKFQRQATPHQRDFVKILKQISNQKPLKLIYEIDDVVFAEDIPMYNRNRDAFTSPEIQGCIKEILSMMDEIVVTCDYFKDYMIEKSGNKNVSVVPNYLMKWWFDRYYNLGDLLKKYEKNKKKPVVAIFASGTHVDVANRTNQQDDFAHVVQHIIKTRTEFNWHFYGSYPMHLKPFIERGEIKFFPWVPLPEFPQAMANSGAQVTFAALQDNNFNKCKCVTGDTMIQIKGLGMTSIKDYCKTVNTIKDDFVSEVWSDDNCYRQTNAVYISPEREKIVKIKTKMGYEIKGTQTHRLLVNGEWKEMQHINVSDKVKISKYELQTDLSYQELKLPFWNTKKITSESFVDIQTKSIAPYIKVNEDFARLFGYLLGDGHFSGGNSVSIVCCNRDQEVIDDVENLIMQMGIVPKTYPSTYSIKNARTINCNSRSLKRMFEWLGMTTQSCSKNLFVPDFIWKSRKSVISNFLKGLFEADGTIGTEISFCTKSQKFAQDIQTLLLGFGIFSKIRKDVSRYTRPSDNKDTDDVIYTGHHYTIRITREGCDIFNREIGFVSEFKKERLSEVCSKSHSNAYKQFDWSDEIVSVEQVEDEVVYDICVPDVKCYVANGIVSHNSNIKLIEAGALGLPCVCPDMVTYKDAFLKYKTGDEFIDCLKTVLKNQNVYADHCKKARAHAETFWLDDEKNLLKHNDVYFTPFGSKDRKYLV